MFLLHVNQKWSICCNKSVNLFDFLVYLVSFMNNKFVYCAHCIFFRQICFRDVSLLIRFFLICIVYLRVEG